jgi:hypothetical protein
MTNRRRLFCSAMSMLFVSKYRTSKAAKLSNIVVFGDSLAQGLYIGLYDDLSSHPDTSVKNHGKQGEGLTRPDYTEFFQGFSNSIVGAGYTDAVIIFGANDDEGLRDEDHKGYAFGSPGWESTYTGRAKAIIDTCRAQGMNVYWLGLPVLRDAERQKDAVYLNGLLEQTASQNGATFISLEDDFKGKDGKFALYLPNSEGEMVQARAEDGTHFTTYGYDMIGRKVYKAMSDLQTKTTPIMLSKS